MSSSVLSIIERSNQRGGRMFSVVDLIEAGTLSLGQAAWLLDRIRQGASWFVGAKPGGAGKTTVMSALLGCLPRDTEMYLTNPGTGWENARCEDCVVAYEIGQGPYDAYIWGQALREFAELGTRGVRIVTNLHADTVAQARAQIVDQNGVSEDGFQAFGLFLPIELNGFGWSKQRRVRAIFRSSGGQWEELPRRVTEEAAEEKTRDFLEDCVKRNVRLVEDVRQAWLEHKDGG